ncbi:hypothetical protein N8787_05570 [Opitutaceae bacterium]|nr:hypothetical protein [Opitutaceae bacterium]
MQRRHSLSVYLLPELNPHDTIWKHYAEDGSVHWGGENEEEAR